MLGGRVRRMGCFSNADVDLSTEKLEIEKLHTIIQKGGDLKS